MTFKPIRIIAVFNTILVLVVIGLFLLLARDIVSFYLTPKGKSQVQIPVKRQKSGAEKSLSDYSAILKKNPFGFYAGELSFLGSKSEGSKVSSDISLVGTVSGDRKFAYAIFADKSNTQEIFKIGDSVFGFGKLEKVERDRVLINDKGRIKVIQITDIITIRESYLPGVKTNISSLPQRTSDDSLSGDKFVKKLADTSYVIDGQKVQQALANPNQIMTDARLLPNIADGKQEGFMLKEVRQGGIYQGLGLQDGDVLLRINEYNISNPESALQAFTALKGMDRVQLDIIRNSAKVTMTYQLR